MRAVLFLGGYAELRADEREAPTLLDLFLQKDLSFSELSAGEDGGIRLLCPLRCLRKLQGNASFRVVRRGGLPILLLRLLHRPGLIVGGLCTLVLIWLSGLFVWDVRVSGNCEMSDADVIRELRACGFGVGTCLRGFSAGEAENRVLLQSDRLSWVSINMNGTVARVQVTERAKAPETPITKKPADLVARVDGQIEYLELYRGNAVVHVGQAVRTGELLVSGIFESENAPCRFTRAAGKVIARTTHTFRVEIPLCDTETVCYGSERGNVWLNFFGFRGKISENTGNDTVNCDIIETDKRSDLPFLQNLPIYLTVETRRLLREEPIQRTEAEALALAYERLELDLRRLAEDAQLLSRVTETTLTEDAVILECTVRCLEDIAEQAEFDVID